MSNVAMVYIPDLDGAGSTKSVGYLACGQRYARGEVADAVLRRLAELSNFPLWGSCGIHSCDLGACTFLPPFLRQGCSTDILVPDGQILYAAPELILHYIRWHRYQPPACFVEAVLRCPKPGSNEYYAALKNAAPTNEMMQAALSGRAI